MKKSIYYLFYIEVISKWSNLFNLNSISHRIIHVMVLVFMLSSCKKLIEVDGPKTSVSSANMYEQDVMAISVLTGIYAKLSARLITGGDEVTSISYLAGLSSDELTLASSDEMLKGYYLNKLSTLDAQNNPGTQFWNNIYTNLYIVNAALEGVSNSATLTPAVKQQLIGEAKFMRAFCFFYLVNLYGDVPLVLSTDYKVNSLIHRSSKDYVWQQIVKDLKEAQAALSSNYLGADLLSKTQERVRPTKAAATALLSRVYLYQKDWKDAEEQATSLIENNTYDLVFLNEVFKKNNNEAIWQLQVVNTDYNASDAVAFIIDPIVGPGIFQPGYLSDGLMKSFDVGDQRKKDWTNSLFFDGITYFYPYKYKIGNVLGGPVSEYSTILRLGEQYLIRAEARIQQNKIAEGVSDLNVLRERATDKSSPLDLQLKMLNIDLPKESALLAVEHERQTELFTEWGHRWLDLKRTGRVDVIMEKALPNKIGGGIWMSYQQWYPLPLWDLQKNPNLTQNQNY